MGHMFLEKLEKISTDPIGVKYFAFNSSSIEIELFYLK
jgi:hypothetical protein